MESERPATFKSALQKAVMLQSLGGDYLCMHDPESLVLAFAELASLVDLLPIVLVPARPGS